MENFFEPSKNTLRAIEGLYQIECKPTKLDKFIEIIKAVSSANVWGFLGQGVEAAAKVCNTLSAVKYRTDAVKYVADAYEMKLRAEEEMARINERTQHQLSKERIIRLYIDKKFQKEVDCLSKQILLDSHKIDLEHRENLAKIKNEHKFAIHTMDNLMKEHLHSIDKQYAMMVATNEMLCHGYRQYLCDLKQENTMPSDMIKFVTERFFNVFEAAIYHPGVNEKILTSGLDSTLQLLDFFAKESDPFITFEHYIQNYKNIQEVI